LNFQNWGLGKQIFAIFGCSAHIATKWLEIDQDNLRIKFSANVDFSSPSPDPLGSRRLAQAGVKDGYLVKSGYLPLMARVA